MIALAIDASTYRGTVAVFRDGEVVATGESVMRGATSEALMPTVAKALAIARYTAEDEQHCTVTHTNDGASTFTDVHADIHPDPHTDSSARPFHYAGPDDVL